MMKIRKVVKIVGLSVTLLLLAAVTALACHLVGGSCQNYDVVVSGGGTVAWRANVTDGENTQVQYGSSNGTFEYELPVEWWLSNGDAISYTLVVTRFDWWNGTTVEVHEGAWLVEGCVCDASLEVSGNLPCFDAEVGTEIIVITGTLTITNDGWVGTSETVLEARPVPSDAVILIEPAVYTLTLRPQQTLTKTFTLTLIPTSTLTHVEWVVATEDCRSEHNEGKHVVLGLEMCNPTSVELSRFEAIALEEAVKLEWETVNESDLLGFNVYRAESADGPWTKKLNEELIPSKVPGSPVGSTYSFLDENVQPVVTYYYMLEVVDVNGETQDHGPVIGTPMLPTMPPPYKIHLPFVAKP